MELALDQTVFPRGLESLERGDLRFVVDASRPNWAAVNEPAAALLTGLEAPATVGELVERHRARHSGLDAATARREVSEFIQEASAAQLLGLEPHAEAPYAGRADVLTPTRLEEFWVQINDFCNLACAHCLVSSSPAAGRGLPPERVRAAVQQALDLGAEMIGITGGEPFFRDDIFDLYELILSDPARTITTLTNGTRLKGETLEKLKRVADERVELRVSLDGPTAEINDAIRGPGSFAAALRGIRNAQEAGCRVTVTMAVNGVNAPHADRMPRLVRELGVQRLHVLWPFQRGRAIEQGQDEDLTPSALELIEGYRRIRGAAAEEGVSFFTYDSWKVRIDGAPGLKYDLANHCWSSLCLYTDGNVFPSPALTQHPELALGNIGQSSLRELWLGSPVARRFRQASVVDRPQCRDCSFRFLCGGGDMDHIYNTSRMEQRDRGELQADDPYCDLYKEILADAMSDWSIAAARKTPSARNGNGTSPRLIRRMGHRPNRPPQQLTAGETTLATLPST